MTDQAVTGTALALPEPIALASVASASALAPAARLSVASAWLSKPIAVA